jgi:hypothetical protein
MFVKILISSLLIGLVTAQSSPFGFQVQFIGQNLSTSQQHEGKEKFCESLWCIFDANILFTRSSQYFDANPCEDFKNFSIGTSMEVSVVNDRYIYRGLSSEIEFKYWEKLRRILVEKIKPKENRVVKITKNIFQKCIKSEHVLRHIDGHREIISYLQSLGGSPYLSHHISFNDHLFDFEHYEIFTARNSSLMEDTLWNNSDFSVKRLFKAEPSDSLWFLMSYELQRCLDGKSLCLTYISTSEWNEVVEKSVLEVLELMNDNFSVHLNVKKELREKMFRPAIENFKEFSKTKEAIEGRFGNKLKAKTRQKIRDLSEATNLNWTEIINDQLIGSSAVSENDYVNVESFELLKRLGMNLKNLKSE